MVGPVAESWDIVGQRRQLAGDEIPEGLATRVNVVAVSVDKIHRHIEHIVDIALEAETALEHERQGAAPVGIGIGPHEAALAEKTGGLSLDKRRVRE